jgi:hypothetical protein
MAIRSSCCGVPRSELQLLKEGMLGIDLKRARDYSTTVFFFPTCTVHYHSQLLSTQHHTDLYFTWKIHDDKLI